MPQFSDPATSFLEATQCQQQVENGLLQNRKFGFDKFKRQLDILTFLHPAGLARWKDRRENKWKLNYAVWAAIAALDALLLHDRATALTIPLVWIVLGILACVALHFAYLWPTIERAISEIELQCDAEHALRDLIADEALREMVDLNHLGGAIRRYKPTTSTRGSNPASS